MIFWIAILALRIYIVLLWGRFILEWIRVLNPRFTPKGALLMLVELLYTVTDPPLKLVRKVLPPLRIGEIVLDVALMVVLFAAWALIQLLAFAAANF